MTKTQKAKIQAQVSKLSGIVHSENLYHFSGMRVVNPRIVNGEIFLEELGSTVQARHIDGHFKNGWGYNVKLAER